MSSEEFWGDFSILMSFKGFSGGPTTLNFTTMQLCPTELEHCFCTYSNNFACQGLWWWKPLGMVTTTNKTYNTFMNHLLHKTSHYQHQTEGSCYQSEIACYLAIDIPVVLNSRPLAL